MEGTTKERTDAADIIAVSRQAAALKEVEPSQNYVALDTDGHASILDLEKLRERPDMVRGTYHPADVASFVKYVETHKNDAETTIWVHPTVGEIVAVIDDASAADPGWRKHRVELELKHSKEWLFWMAQDGKLMEQQAFAEHLREGLVDIAEPAGATLLEIATTFEAKTSVEFRSGVDLSSGEAKFKYDESTEATGRTAADGEIAVPRQFILVLTPFLGEEEIQITANLRHRAQGGNLRLGYKLERPERAVEDALEKVADRLDDRFDRVYRGTPA